MRSTLSIAALASLLLATPVFAQPAPQTDAPAAEPAPAESAPKDILTTDVRPEEGELDLGRFLLEFPTLLVETAFMPLYPLIYAIERWDLISRTLDLVTNEHRTIALVPIINFVSLRSGVGFGGLFAYNEPFGSADRTVFSVMVTTKGNRSASLSSVNRLPSLDGRRLSINANYNVKKDHPYYGLGRDRAKGLIRTMRIDAVDAAVGLTLFDPASDLDASVEVAYRYRELNPGIGPEQGVTATDDVAVPMGFGQGLNYPEITARFIFDSRDAIGRTTRGIQASIEGSATKDIDRGDTGGFRFTGKFRGFLPVLPLNRVLVLSFGATAAFPVIGSDDDIPFHHLGELGGEDLLRSYPSGRFVDRFAWWGTVEYRWKTFEIGSSGNGLSSFLFFDIGNVARDPDGLFDGKIPWSVGFGVRAEASLLLLGRLQVAGGPEGVRVSLGLGELP